jgi:hypothetical protein
MENDQDNQNTQSDPPTETPATDSPQTPDENPQTTPDTSAEEPGTAGNQTSPETLQASDETQTQQMTEPSTPPDPNARSPKMLIVGLVFVLVISLLGGSYFYFQNQKTETPEPAPAETQETPPPTPDPTADWEIYTTSVYQVKYPGNLITGGDESMLNIAKWGPTQTEGTELFDGYAITFIPKETSEMTPEEYADEQIAELNNQGISKVTEGPNSITIANYKGITYTEDGLGTYKQIVLGSNDGTMLMVISVIIADPGNLGFQEEVDQILSSFKFTPET